VKSHEGISFPVNAETFAYETPSNSLRPSQVNPDLITQLERKAKLHLRIAPKKNIP